MSELIVPIAICLVVIVVTALVYFCVASIKTRAAERREQQALRELHGNRPNKRR